MNAPMMNLSPQRRQSMYNMIENAAKEQAKELAWVSNLFKKRLENLQQMDEHRRRWLKQKEDDELA